MHSHKPNPLVIKLVAADGEVAKSSPSTGTEAEKVELEDEQPVGDSLER